MPAATPTNIDPTSAAIAIATIVFGPEAAEYVGPYSVIILASITGSGWALSRRGRTGHLRALLFVARLVATALALSLAIESSVDRWLISLDSHWLLAPIALVVGGIGDDWPGIVRWCVQRVVVFTGKKERGNGAS
jgi:hypothetical protein